ncbi:glycosyltransferase family 4 protein [Nostoc sp. LEGE 06077]|uniref:glycosyltransferase family 4 protein n=1 Tax=Nostoc sp. LEGE 06077 TaxID=915325 RepID=UPI00187EF8EF|nr:glycosyltransferase family 4 protein [Nostoc sp. LEGE 06077]MBE9209044.1 glycosyltransferase family 4 protein [Nostoc sp. LEGE 06077]
MKTISQDTLSLWQKEGINLIPKNFAVFRSLVSQTKTLVKRHKYEEAAVCAEMAAWFACGQPCGLFVSMELEQVLLEIGKQAISYNNYLTKDAAISKSSRPKNVVHVCTSVMSIGGLSKMLWRWIQQDIDSSHSIVLTKQESNEIPQILKDSVSQSHGKIYILNKEGNGILSKAKKLREIVATADVVVLHVYSQDVIPMIAFANKEQSPPVIFLDHADHLFWLGASISDVVANLRESGMRLSQERRGIETERSILLPTIVEPTYREFSPIEAKRKLGIEENTIVLLSIARSVKYSRLVDGLSFADAHLPILNKYKNVCLLVVGVNNPEGWSAAIEQTQGRIKAIAETDHTSTYYQAADIYVDSFPFVSITSLLEAGSYGIPLVSRYPYFSGASAILGADMPGLTGNLIRVRSLEEYINTLSSLIEDEELRISLGESTRNKIAQTHWANNWQTALEKVYLLATTLPRINTQLVSNEKDQICLGEPDIFLPSVYGWYSDFTLAIQPYLKFLPFNQRLFYWYKLVKKHGVRNRISLLLPNWFYSLYQSWKINFKF